MIEVRQLTPDDSPRHLSALAEVLLDCIAGGASVSFMASFSQSEAEAFFQNVFQSVARGERILLAAFSQADLVGTIQILTALPPNQPHRAELAKLLVLRSARGQGVGQQLLQEAEAASRRAGKTLLVLDTAVGGPAEKLYTRLGWTRVGIIPNYALYPDGSSCDTALFWKALE